MAKREAAKVGEPKKKWDTAWYDDLCMLYQKVKSFKDNPQALEAANSLRNVLWDQVKSLINSKVREYIVEKRRSQLRSDPDLCQKLYQEGFFIFQKACDIWNPDRNTKFLTFLGDILDQEILNIIRLHNYYKTREYKIKARLSQEVEDVEEHEEDIEKQELLERVKILCESYSFGSQLERNIVFTAIYGKLGDWSKLQATSDMGIGSFYKLRDKTLKAMRAYILANCEPRLQDVLKEILEEK
jgi:hypothetical protein